MSNKLDVVDLINWLNQSEDEAKATVAESGATADPFYDGVLSAIFQIREYIKKMSKIDDAEGKADQKWIPCSERMPKGTVLCCDDRGNMLVGLLCKDEAGYIAYGDDGQEMYNCVAWMQLPEPYREEEQDHETD